MGATSAQLSKTDSVGAPCSARLTHFYDDCSKMADHPFDKEAFNERLDDVLATTIKSSLH